MLWVADGSFYVCILSYFALLFDLVTDVHNSFECILRGGRISKAFTVLNSFVQRLMETRN